MPEIQEPEAFVQESPEAARTETDELTSNASLKNKGSVAKETATGKKQRPQVNLVARKAKLLRNLKVQQRVLKNVEILGFQTNKFI